MKLRYLYSIMCIFSLLALPGCREEEAMQTSEGTRTVTVNLGIAMSRVTDIGDGTPEEMQVWIFESGTNNCLAYIPNNSPVFSGSDLLGELVNTDEYKIELDNNITALDFYVVLNASNGEGINLDNESTPDDIKAASFTALSGVTVDNEVPAYGCWTNFSVADHKNSYALPKPIEVTRAVSKLELFFTKESEKSDLAITEITLKNIPDKGFLAKEATTDDALTYSTQDITLFTGSENIDKYLSEDIFGDFSTKPENFTSITLSQPYLLENPYNTAWSDNGNADYEFPQPEEADAKAYVATVSYTLNSKAETRSFVLPEVKRNIWNKIFVRVNDNGELIIQYKALPWELVESSIGYAPQPASTSENPFTEKNYDDFMAGNNYILLPLEKYEGYNTTQALFSYLYDNPEAGDNEARLCIITRPTYDNNIDDNEHWALKTGSAGARYLFMLTGPEGATWEAHLNDPDGNFDFSTSVNNEDFEGCTDEGFSKEVRMVTHGIARKQPYIIQINATHLYTGYQKDMKGVSDVDEEPRFDSDAYKQLNISPNKNAWEKYFEDDYLTDWGEAKWNNEEVVDAEFYITVKYPNGEEHELTINPSYSETTIEGKYFPFLQKRRYAGNDTRIWIRHVRAIHAVPNLEYLARDLQQTVGDEEWEIASWWNKNEYWNSNHDESVWKK